MGFHRCLHLSPGENKQTDSHFIPSTVDKDPWVFFNDIVSVCEISSVSLRLKCSLENLSLCRFCAFVCLRVSVCGRSWNKRWLSMVEKEGGHGVRLVSPCVHHCSRRNSHTELQYTERVVHTEYTEGGQSFLPYYLLIYMCLIVSLYFMLFDTCRTVWFYCLCSVGLIMF